MRNQAGIVCPVPPTMGPYQVRIQDFEMGMVNFCNNVIEPKHGNEAFLDYMLDGVFVGSK